MEQTHVYMEQTQYIHCINHTWEPSMHTYIYIYMHTFFTYYYIRGIGGGWVHESMFTHAEGSTHAGMFWFTIWRVN